MKTILLITCCFISYSTCFSQYFIGYENALGAIFEHKPYGSYAIDTIVTNSPNLTGKRIHLNSFNQFSTTENILLGEDNIASAYYNKNVPVRLSFDGGIRGVNQLIVDTNGVFFDSLNFDQSTQPQIDTAFQLSNSSTITARITNPDSNQFYSGTIYMYYDSLVKISVTSNLPSNDTVYIDEGGISFTHIPIGYTPIDTNTVKIDSLKKTLRCASGNNWGETCSFKNTLPYNEYFYSFTVFVTSVYSATISIDLDTLNLYNKVYVSSTGSPFSKNYMINDTVAMDSNSTLYFHLSSGKNDAVFITTERFKTETRISIKQTIGLKSNQLNDEIILFPNPVNDFLKIGRESNTNLKFQLFSVDGKYLFLDGVIINNSLNLKQLQKGVYIIDFPELGVRKKILKN
jgi:hypothetical protein